MSPARKLAATTTVALMFALVGCSEADPEAEASPSPVAGDPSASPPNGVPPETDGPTDLMGFRGPLDPGSYSLAAWGESAAEPLPRAIFEVPEGYFSNGGWIIDAGSDASSEADQYGVVQVWRVDRVLGAPCRIGTATAVRPTVEALARALVRQHGPSTKPIPTELDGHRGLYLEIAVPMKADLASACAGEYTLWLASSDPGPAHSDRPGVVHHLWILDVDDTRLVVAVSNYPDQPEAQHQELITIAESVHFEPADS